MANEIPQERLEQIQAYWRAPNYLGAAQVSLKEDLLLQEPIYAREHQSPASSGTGVSLLIYEHWQKSLEER